MAGRINSRYKLYDVPLRFFEGMLDDIRAARNYICLETYKYYRGTIGDRFLEALTLKAKEGVEVKVLIDSWGAAVDRSYFSELIRAGGEVRFFTKVKFFVDFFTKNHRRNHRKLLIIDDKVSWIGSANITGYSLGWRELMLRIEGDLATAFRKVFNLDFKIYNRYIFEKRSYVKLIRHRDFEIIRDVPSIAMKKIGRKYIQMIRNASRRIIIETPYFLPGYMLRKVLIDASNRGVEVTVIIPRHSDVMLIDILRNKYLGMLHLNGIRFLYYLPENLHAKAMLVDDTQFALGSPNFDYRSFRYMHEIILVGTKAEIIRQLKEHMSETIRECEPFDYLAWRGRTRMQQFFEWLLLPFRHLL